MLRVDTVYFFDLKMVCGGYAYYVTHTSFRKFTAYCREVRYPAPVNARIFMEVAELFRQRVHVIKTVADYNTWLYTKGWAIAPEPLTRSLMPQWLKSAECVKAATQIYTDIDLVAPSAKKHQTTWGRKMQVLTRDKRSCLRCGTAEGEAKLTMHHVRPFSRGGETTSHNVVTLCESCNQELGPEEEFALYQKAGLHCGYDPSLFSAPPRAGAGMRARELSDNLMQTRCEVW